jgi:hypothetical protein
MCALMCPSCVRRRRDAPPLTGGDGALKSRPAAPRGGPGNTALDDAPTRWALKPFSNRVLGQRYGGSSMLTWAHAWWGTVRGSRSLRREARRVLGLGLLPRPAIEGLPVPGVKVPREVASVFALVVVIGLLFVPICVRIGPFDSVADSKAYLETTWQVVATALGLSVAIIAVLFSALLAGTARTVGLSLLEFARGTGMMTVLRFGVSALVVDGLALFPVGHDAPRGWAGFVAVALSGLTFLSVLWVFERAVVSLDPRGLAQLRIRKLRRSAEAALHSQLLRQAGELYLQQQGQGQGIGRSLTSDKQDIAVVAKRTGEVRDVRLRRLRRLVAAENARGHNINLRLLGIEVLGTEVADGTEIAALASGTRDALSRRVRRAVKVRTRRPRPDVALGEELDGLHRQALAAIREGDRQVWDLIADTYVEAMLALPRAAAAYALPFAGAVAAPGLFQLGPLDRMQRFLYEEIEAAVRAGDRSFALDVAYLPARIAQAAAPLNAPALVRAMLDLYPALYLLAQEAAQ